MTYDSGGCDFCITPPSCSFAPRTRAPYFSAMATRNTQNLFRPVIKNHRTVGSNIAYSFRIFIYLQYIPFLSAILFLSFFSILTVFFSSFCNSFIQYFLPFPFFFTIFVSFFLLPAIYLFLQYLLFSFFQFLFCLQLFLPSVYLYLSFPFHLFLCISFCFIKLLLLLSLSAYFCIFGWFSSFLGFRSFICFSFLPAVRVSV